MANLEPMPISSLPELDKLQDGDEAVIYRPSTGKAYQAPDLLQDLEEKIQENTDLIDSFKSNYVTQERIEIENFIIPAGSTASTNILAPTRDGYKLLQVVNVASPSASACFYNCYLNGSNIVCGLRNFGSSDMTVSAIRILAFWQPA